MLTLRTVTDPNHSTKGSELSWQEMDQNLINLYNLLGNVLETGFVIDYAGGSAPSGWLLSDGSTIGSGSSGADYANSDAEALFKLIWDNTSNSNYQLLDSGGSNVSRGASAQDDWDNDRRIPLPDNRGRVSVGSGQGSGLTQRNHLVSFGSESDNLSHSHTNTFSIASAGSETITSSTNGAHTHTGSVQVDSAGAHTHNINVTSTVNGDHTHTGNTDYNIADFGQIDDHGTTEITQGTESAVTVVQNPTHSITTNNNGGHLHSFTTASAGEHTHDIQNKLTDSAGSHSHSTSNFTVNSNGDHTHDITTSDHTHTLNGSIDNALSNVDRSQPSIAFNKIIKL